MTKLFIPTPEEDAEINAGIALDDEAAEFKEEDFARAEFGVPKSLEPYVKQPISIRLDPDLLKAMRDTGKGWQTRANDALREHFGLSSHEDKS